MDYSTKYVSDALYNEIKSALQDLGYGSVEIYVQDHKVVQITKRIIKKTNSKMISK